MLQVKEIQDKQEWERFLSLLGPEFYPLFQSWNWGEVQKKRGFSINRLGFYKKNLVGVSLVIDVPARRGHYLHVRHGPVLSSFDPELFDAVITEIRKIAKEKKASFIRISPLLNVVSNNTFFFKSRGFISAPIHRMDAEICWVLDITRSDEELMSGMRKSHRYLIRKSQTLGITITPTTNTEDIDKFLSIYKTLSKRKHFIPHAGIKEEFEIFSKDNQAVLYLAEYEKKIIGGVLILYMDKMAIYHHAATLAEYRDIPSSYLLQWTTIKEAKKRGIPVYNFWGVSPLTATSHPWHGLSLFKMGFGGKLMEFTHAQDLPLNIFYWKSYFIEFATKIRKGY